MSPVRLGSGQVTVRDIVDLAEGCASLEIGPALLDRLAAARAILESSARSGLRIYGLNTGLGAKVGVDLAGVPSKEATHAFQSNLVRGRVIGVGEPLSETIVRSAIAARCSMLAQCGSGISIHVFQALAALLDARVHPVVPRFGSLGESDLGLLAHVALVLIGEGWACYEGELMPGAEALKRAGLAPVELGLKDGLSLINASAVSVGRGALVAEAAQALSSWQTSVAALSFAAVRANRQVFDPAIQSARPASGQVEAAGRFRLLLDDADYAAAGLQDPLSFRCLASLTGALDDAVERARAQVELELNAAADNPLVLWDEQILCSTGNFASPSFALSFENLGLAMAQAAQGSVARLVHLGDGRRAGLPRALSPVGGTSAGIVPLQKTAMALLAEVRRNANPVMLDFWPVSEGVEDHATQSPLVAEKSDAIIQAWRQLVALELLAACQAVDLQANLALDGCLRRLHGQVRELVPGFQHDRPHAFDLSKLVELIASTPPVA